MLSVFFTNKLKNRGWYMTVEVITHKSNQA